VLVLVLGLVVGFFRLNKQAEGIEDEDENDDEDDGWMMRAFASIRAAVFLNPP
jgi:hypothetical protein